jgi:hypothetical protein
MDKLTKHEIMRLRRLTARELVKTEMKLKSVDREKTIHVNLDFGARDKKLVAELHLESDELTNEFNFLKELYAKLSVTE